MKTHSFNFTPVQKEESQGNYSEKQQNMSEQLEWQTLTENIFAALLW